MYILLLLICFKFQVKILFKKLVNPNFKFISSHESKYFKFISHLYHYMDKTKNKIFIYKYNIYEQMKMLIRQTMKWKEQYKNLKHNNLLKKYNTYIKYLIYRCSFLKNEIDKLFIFSTYFT